MLQQGKNVPEVLDQIASALGVSMYYLEARLPLTSMTGGIRWPGGQC